MLQVNILVGDRELLVDANLRLFAGVHYGLVGRNGTGKSTLLKSLGWGLLVGLPSTLRVLYVDQLEGVEGDMSVVDVVMEADRRGQALSERAGMLQGALETGGVEEIVVVCEERIGFVHLAVACPPRQLGMCAAAGVAACEVVGAGG